MKRYSHLLCFLLITLSLIYSSGCKKLPVDPLTFDVKLDSMTFKTGDTINFNLSGNPDMLVFYSGEPGKRYANSKRTKMAGFPYFLFQASMQQGVIPNGDSMQLLISTNLKGYDSTGVTSATWTDITSRNTRWPITLATTYTNSDSISLADFNAYDSVNIAFHFLGKKSTISAQRKWLLQGIVLNNLLADSTNTQLFPAFANVGWVELSLKNFAKAWNVGTWNISTATSVNNSSGIPIRSAYPITFDPGADVNTADNDDWLITSAVDLKTVKPDQGTVIKNVTAIPLTSYKYIFRKPGTYTVSFVAQNLNVSDKIQIVKEFQITVTN